MDNTRSNSASSSGTTTNTAGGFMNTGMNDNDVHGTKNEEHGVDQENDEFTLLESENRRKIVDIFKKNTNTAIGSDINLTCLNHLFEGISKNITNLFCGIAERPADSVSICLEGCPVSDLTVGNVIAVIYGSCWSEKEIEAVYIVTKNFEDFCVLEIAEAMLEQIDKVNLVTFPAYGIISKNKSTPNLVLIICNEFGWTTAFSGLFPDSTVFNPGKSFKKTMLKKSAEFSFIPSGETNVSSFNSMPQSSFMLNQKSSERLAQLRPLQNILNHDNKALSQIIDTNACNLDSSSVPQFLRRVMDPYMMSRLNAFGFPHPIFALLKFQFHPTIHTSTKHQVDASFESKDFKSNFILFKNFHPSGKITSIDELLTALMNLMAFITTISNTSESNPRDRWRLNFELLVQELSRQDNNSLRFYAEKGAIDLVLHHFELALSNFSLVLCHQETTALSLVDMDSNIRRALSINMPTLRQEYLDGVITRLHDSSSTHPKRVNQHYVAKPDAKDYTQNKFRRVGSSPKNADAEKVYSKASSTSFASSLPPGKRNGFLY
jgi:hypothetical protein